AGFNRNSAPVPAGEGRGNIACRGVALVCDAWPLSSQATGPTRGRWKLLCGPRTTAPTHGTGSRTRALGTRIDPGPATTRSFLAHRTNLPALGLEPCPLAAAPHPGATRRRGTA